jgi:hypothetical protein
LGNEGCERRRDRVEEVGRTKRKERKKERKKKVNLLCFSLLFSLFLCPRALRKQAQAKERPKQSHSPTRDEGTLVTREVVRCGSDADGAASFHSAPAARVRAASAAPLPAHLEAEEAAGSGSDAGSDGDDSASDGELERVA